MSRYRLEWLVCLVAFFGLSGCANPTQRLNAPPQGEAEYPSDLQPFFSYMVDAAMISDVSIADIHFVPHTTELNSLGTTRLSRMASFLDAYGGTIRYTARIADEDLVDPRMAHVRDFLATTGIDMSRVDVQVALAGSTHTSAERAINATEKGEAWEDGHDTLWFETNAIGDVGQ